MLTLHEVQETHGLQSPEGSPHYDVHVPEERCELLGE